MLSMASSRFIPLNHRVEGRRLSRARGRAMNRPVRHSSPRVWASPARSSMEAVTTSAIRAAPGPARIARMGRMKGKSRAPAGPHGPAAPMPKPMDAARRLSAKARATRPAKLVVFIVLDSGDPAEGAEEQGHEAGEDADPAHEADHSHHAVRFIDELVHNSLRFLDVLAIHLVTVNAR